jgi:peptidoglycan biosynthesis protein MviN/MurJ (putative lipid II flippase)
MKPQLVIDILGWTGTGFLVLAYFLVSRKVLAGDSLNYQLLNLAGGGLLTLNSFYYGAFPSVALNIVWIGIAIFTLSKRKSS